MKVLIFWDIYWRIGRHALKKEIPFLKQTYNPDFVIANIDNVSSWRGAIQEHIMEIESLGVDIMTGGDHLFDHFSQNQTYLNDENSKLLRPANVYESELYPIAWKGYRIFEKHWKKLLVIHILWNTYMKFSVYNPFLKVQEILALFESQKLDGIIIDFHKETTADGYGMWFLVDGKVSCVFWTHTHIQTNDEIILPQWTGLISDVWMSGSQLSVIGASFESVKKMFLSGIS